LHSQVDTLALAVQRAEAVLHEDQDEKLESIMKRKEIAKKKLVAGLATINAKTHEYFEVHVEWVGTQLTFAETQDKRRKAEQAIGGFQRDLTEARRKLDDSKARKAQVKKTLVETLKVAQATLVKFHDDRWKESHEELMGEYEKLPDDLDLNKVDLIHTGLHTGLHYTIHTGPTHRTTLYHTHRTYT
jgi:hypothetical protein